MSKSYVVYAPQGVKIIAGLDEAIDHLVDSILARYSPASFANDRQTLKDAPIYKTFYGGVCGATRIQKTAAHDYQVWESIRRPIITYWLEEVGGEVDLIASGYEWFCPACEELNKEIEAPDYVSCDHCGRAFLVSPDLAHAMG